MKWFDHLPIKKKISTVIGVAMLLLIAVSSIGYQYLYKANQEMTGMYRDKMLSLHYSGDSYAFMQIKEQEYATTMKLFVISYLFIIVAITVIGLLWVRKIIKPAERISIYIKHLPEGAFSQYPGNIFTSEEIGQLSDAMIAQPPEVSSIPIGHMGISPELTVQAAEQLAANYQQIKEIIQLMAGISGQINSSALDATLEVTKAATEVHASIENMHSVGDKIKEIADVNEDLAKLTAELQAVIQKIH